MSWSISGPGTLCLDPDAREHQHLVFDDVATRLGRVSPIFAGFARLRLGESEDYRRQLELMALHSARY